MPAPTPAPSPTPTPSPTPSPSPPAGGSVDAEQDEMLSAMLAVHNAARNEVGVPQLELDDDLNRAALDYAEELARTGLFQHSPGGSRPGQGENLWAGTTAAFSYDQMATAWVEEKRYFKHDVFPNVSTTGNWQDVGHYTQIIWRDTTRFGCGLATGLGRDWLVCRYSPPGNFTGQRVY